jgi:hypothetical protein
MLTIAPLIWAYATYLALQTAPADLSRFGTATSIALCFLVLAVAMDYLFFGLIRNALDELYHPTTFYGYAFVVILPYGMIWLIKSMPRKHVTNHALYRAGIVGLACLAGIWIIIQSGITI